MMEHNLNTRKGICEAADQIISHYKRHGVKLAIEHYEIIEAHERVIFQIELKKGETAKRFFGRAPDVQIALRLPLFQPFIEGITLYLAISYRENAKNDLIGAIQRSMRDSDKMKLPYTIGYDIRGNPYTADLWDFPTLVLGGTSNSGKTTALRSLIVSIAYNRSPKDVIFFLIDTGANSLTAFDNLPHLGRPVIKTPEEGAQVILWLAMELDRIASAGDATNIIPAFVAVIDDLPSFISKINDENLRKMVTDAITELLRRGRHANIHTILATQNPTKASTSINWDCVECRMSFKFPQYQQSMAILGITGAEKLNGKGSLLFIPPGKSEPVQLQGAFISPEDVERVVAMLSDEYYAIQKFQLDDAMLPDLYDDADVTLENRPQPRQKQRNVELCKIILWALGQEHISALQIMDTFHMGNRANGIIDKLTEMGIVSDKFTKQPREVLPRRMEDLSDETIAFLTNNGVTMHEIQEAVREKPESSFNLSRTVLLSAPSKTLKKARRPINLKSLVATTDKCLPANQEFPPIRKKEGNL